MEQVGAGCSGWDGVARPAPRFWEALLFHNGVGCSHGTGWEEGGVVTLNLLPFLGLFVACRFVSAVPAEEEV